MKIGHRFDFDTHPFLLFFDQVNCFVRDDNDFDHYMGRESSIRIKNHEQTFFCQSLYIYANRCLELAAKCPIFWKFTEKSAESINIKFRECISCSLPTIVC